MGTISAKDLRASLEKALDMGITEEAFDLCGHRLVVRNLRPHEIEEVIESCKGLEDLAYFNAYQREHIARGLCEIDGVDLRGVTFIDDEEPDPKNRGQVRKVRVERHRWISERILATWGPDVILLAYRKIGDCSTQAEKQSKEGVTFLLPDETPEQKYRRVLGELKEIEEEVPRQLLDRTLEEFGLVRRSTLDELKAVDERLNKIREAEIEAEKAHADQGAEVKVPQADPGDLDVQATQAAQEVEVKAQHIMANRTPLNQGAAPPPESPASSSVSLSSRAAELQALEADADRVGVLAAGPVGAKPVIAYRLSDTATLGGPSPPLPDPEQRAQAAQSIIEPPVRGGLNPKFRPPPKV